LEGASWKNQQTFWRCSSFGLSIALIPILPINAAASCTSLRQFLYIPMTANISLIITLPKIFLFAQILQNDVPVLHIHQPALIYEISDF
jgi:hypothetical protein